MKKYIVSAATLGAVLLAFAAKNNDPVLMQINGKDVKLSEFEYLYNKNSAQQLEPQPLEQYVEMFADYKRKVADAEAAGIDTTAAFRSELDRYCYDLARPYLRDTALEDSLLQVSYDHFKEDVLVSHIMIADGNNEADHLLAVAKLDSLRNLIISGKEDFKTVASHYSIDNASRQNGGLMGIVMPGRYPWAFEEAAYNTAVGEISPVVNSGYGLHIIRPERRTPAKGEVHAAHILRLTRGVAPEKLPEVKATIDSIYAVVITPGTDFAEVATNTSEDTGTARRGGDLGWFSPGMMVQPFDSIAFALADGAISEPFQTAFGYHIIKRYDHRGIAEFDAMRDKLMQQMQNDQRGLMPEQRRLQQLAVQYKAAIDEKTMAKLPNLKQSDYSKYTIFTVDGKKTPLSEVIDRIIAEHPDTPFAIDDNDVRKTAQQMMDAAVLQHAMEMLSIENADYRNLTNEYRDGILMFEISNRKVWDRASKDPAGLEKYFEVHRADYTWDKPKYKAFILFTTSEEMLDNVKAYTDSIGKPDPSTFVEQMNKQFGRDVKVERVIAGKGDNAITDYLGFGCEKPETTNSRWAYYYAVDGQILNAPEEAVDVKGAVTADYQSELEQEWLQELRAKYPVKINQNVLQQVK